MCTSPIVRNLLKQWCQYVRVRKDKSFEILDENDTTSWITNIEQHFVSASAGQTNTISEERIPKDLHTSAKNWNFSPFKLRAEPQRTTSERSYWLSGTVGNAVIFLENLNTENGLSSIYNSSIPMESQAICLKNRWCSTYQVFDMGEDS